MTRSTTVGLIEEIDNQTRYCAALSEYELTPCGVLLRKCRDELAKQAERFQLFFRIADYAGFDIESRDLSELPQAVADLNVRNAKQAERVAELEGLVHDCPKCGESCKECNCHRTEVRELVEVLKGILDWDDTDELLDDCIRARAILAKHESGGE
jgi:hypothetical protein